MRTSQYSIVSPINQVQPCRLFPSCLGVRKAMWVWGAWLLANCAVWGKKGLAPLRMKSWSVARHSRLAKKPASYASVSPARGGWIRSIAARKGLTRDHLSRLYSGPGNSHKCLFAFSTLSLKHKVYVSVHWNLPHAGKQRCLIHLRNLPVFCTGLGT